MQINKHGSFYMRNGWVTKIIDATIENEMIFSPNNELNSVDTIGVGRVMIKAMRYWSVVLGISDEIKAAHGVIHRLTKLGNLICDYDPFCQNIGTLWLLHRNLSSNKDNATAWYWAFNHMNKSTFSKESFSDEFYSYIINNGESYAKNAIEKEFDCFKNTYVSEKRFDINKIMVEDTIPFFSNLKLINYIGKGEFRFNKTSSNDIPLPILLYCILSDNKEHLKNNKQLSIDTIMENENQVGRYMCISYSTLLDLLQQLENTKKLQLVNNFGNRYIQINYENEMDMIIEEYYQGMER